MHFFGLSDVGRKRQQNEDAFEVSDAHQFCVLADGMGGRDHGEVASAMAVTLLSDHFRNDLPLSSGRLDPSQRLAMAVTLLDDWILGVNRAIYEKAKADDSFEEMGTTLVCLLALGDKVVLAHVGDSRCYRFRDGQLTQLTEDHSLVNSQVKSGLLTAEQARESNQRNIITRAVGTAEKVRPDIAVLDSAPKDRYLLCSDGLHDMIPSEQLAMAMGRNVALEEVARVLVDAANAAGGKDNITVVLGQASR